jgi:hypothetical protein
MERTAKTATSKHMPLRIRSPIFESMVKSLHQLFKNHITALLPIPFPLS